MLRVAALPTVGDLLHGVPVEKRQRSKEGDRWRVRLRGEWIPLEVVPNPEPQPESDRLDSWWGICPACGKPPTDAYKHRYQIAFCEPCQTQWGVRVYRAAVEAGEL